MRAGLARARASKRRVSWTIARRPPGASIWRRDLVARWPAATKRKELMFFSSMRVPSAVGPAGGSRRWRRSGSEPSSRLPSLTPRNMRTSRKRRRYSAASSAERRSGSLTISRSGTPARLRSTPGAVAADAVEVLAGVLLHVDPGEPHPPARRRRPRCRRRRQRRGQVVLADLVALGQVRVEVVLPREDARLLDRAAERERGAHGQLDRLAVEDRQGARQAQADGADVGVGPAAEGGRAAAEDLGPREELGVDLEADDGLPVGESHPCYRASVRSPRWGAAARRMPPSAPPRGRGRPAPSPPRR